ncbi:MAG: phosphate ABC transporter substrate-binding protein PstS [Acidimicrobiales bacterium]|nr:phosphate ABC transporter substrate-binding protein PstS [Acidimicrobiales bacterium]
MKRLIPLALLVPLALAACSSSKPSSSSGTPTSTAPPTTSGPKVQTGNPTSSVTLSEDGSSLLLPYLQGIEDPLHTQYSNVTLNAAAGGSGKGISDATAGTVQMGGSDAYLSPAQLAANATLLNIPIVISSQDINYNLKGVDNLKLSGDVLAKIYEGQIKTWNDPAIAALNSGVTLPSTAIVPVRRVDSSGDTFLFTSFLAATDQTWSNGPSIGTTVTWPAVSSEVTASGNPGMVQTCSATPGCIAYVGVSAESAAQTAGLGVAMLKNKDGNFVSNSTATVNAAVQAGSGSIPDNLAQPLIFEPGAQSWPIVNYEYIIVKSQQANADTALAIRDFLTYAMDPNGGSSQQYLSKASFQALPSSVLPKIDAAIAKITG